MDILNLVRNDTLIVFLCLISPNVGENVIFQENGSWTKNNMVQQINIGTKSQVSYQTHTAIILFLTQETSGFHKNTGSTCPSVWYQKVVGLIYYKWISMCDLSEKHCKLPFIFK